MRGKGIWVKKSWANQRITPAYAGKSSLSNARARSNRDHPRVCGEKQNSSVTTTTRIRITPAYAGKSFSFLPQMYCFRDHPRVCGEKQTKRTRALRLMGSPPRMRGKGEGRRLSFGVAGITPAYAGKRLKRSRSTVPPVAIVPLFPSVCNKPVVSDGSPAGRDAPLFLPAENAVPASPAYNLRSL